MRASKRCTDGSDSPRRSRKLDAAPPSAFSTSSLPDACTCSSATTSPVTQSRAESVIRNDAPTLAMVPPSTALAPLRWQTSRPTSSETGVAGSRPISRRVACCCCSFSTLRKGDCRSCTPSASFSVPSNIVSPVRLTKSDSTTVSRLASAGVDAERHHNTPATTAAEARGAAIHHADFRAARAGVGTTVADGAETGVAAGGDNRTAADAAGDAGRGPEAIDTDAAAAAPSLGRGTRPLSVALRRRLRSARRSAALW